MKLLLDSVILIDHFNNIEKATYFISQYQNDVGISIITRAEVLTGFQSKAHINLVKRILDKFKQYPLTATEADLAASFRREHHWKLPDAFQAAIAQQHKLKLVTRNTKDFNPQKYHFVLVPYQL
jgi:predicted nucleic acid-binding protein